MLIGNIIKLAGFFCYALVPQIIRILCFDDPIAPSKLHNTSLLNGFRGLAALALFNPLSGLLCRCSTCRRKDVHPWLIQLPVFRLVSSRQLAVLVFFLVAGYALSYRPLQKLSQLDDSTSQKCLYSGASASVFRRFSGCISPALLLTFMTAFV
jgi:hypothetical protein